MASMENGNGLQDAPAHEGKAFVTRAPRFPIQAPLQYRESGEQTWHSGMTVNISRSGILFSAEEPLDPQTVLEMRIAFPPELTGEYETNVVCWGPVVRADSDPEDEDRRLLAASIFRYRFKSN